MPMRAVKRLFVPPPLATPNELKDDEVQAISAAVNPLIMNRVFLPLVTRALVAVMACWTAAGCSDSDKAPAPESEVAATSGVGAVPARPGCDDGNGGITVPAGFCASVFADNLGHARHLAVGPDGTVYVNTWSSMYTKMQNAPGGFVVALRDMDRDGHAEWIERFGTTYQEGKPGGGTGIAVHDDGLFVEVDGTIVRYPLRQGAVAPEGEPDVVLTGMPIDGDHPMHPFAIAADGKLFVNSGSASNACQEKNRAVGSPGRQPCPELATRAGIWRYDAGKMGQVFSPRERFAMGARNSVALTMHRDGGLWAVVHGRDQLSDNWPALYSDSENNELPAEVLERINGDEDLGWPYCYYDQMQSKHVLAPEYGGDGGKAVGGCVTKSRPDGTFPAHWAPEAIVFYTGSAFPNRYTNGAFVSFHGSWNRKPFQSGYLVAFVPFDAAIPTGRHEDFATGFAGAHPVPEPTKAAHRPMGLAVGADGALYVGDDVAGRIWRISYVGP